MWKKWLAGPWKKVGLGLAVLLLADLLASALFIRSAYSTLDQHASPGPFDLAVVFFAGHPDKTHLAGADLPRLQYAAELFHAGTIAHIVCVGGARSWSRSGGARMMRDVLLRSGIPATRVLYDSTSFDSFSNWHNAHQIIRAHRWRTVAFITDPLHLIRLLDIAAAAAELDIAAAPPPHYARPDARTCLVLWQKTHHEWLAWTAAALLPAAIHQKILRYLRNKRLL